MITIKLPYKTSQESKDLLYIMQREYSCVVRWSFNRFQEGFKELQVRQFSKNLRNIENLDSWFIQCAILEAKTLHEIRKDKVIFGGKDNFLKRLRNQISQEEYRRNRLLKLTSQGEACKRDSGNRKLKLNFIENNSLTFKPKKGIKIDLVLPKLHKNYKDQLFKLQQQCERNELALTFSIDQGFIYLTFEEQLEKIVYKSEGNYFGLDLNPNYISCVLFNKDKQLQKSWTFELKQLTSQNNENKIKHELIEIAKEISRLAIKNEVDFVFIEDLNIKSDNHKNGKYFNKLVNNKWKRNVFINNLKKRCNINKISLFEVNPAYSSFIGNLMNEEPDPISAAIEIARRGYEVIIQKTKQFYPKLSISSVQSQWKDFLQDNECSSWKELFSLIKNAKLKYRISWSNDYVFREFITKTSLCRYNCNNYSIGVI